eukprot:c11319_g1_i1.p1 GENE.c11319_g1_i1~~c11319_g1_i1.p1  ORF type:complete len:150 (-),score=11.18 c11319_g1_i1:349-798(-)
MGHRRTMENAAWVTFTNGVRSTLNLWTALNLAVDGQWGGAKSDKKKEELVLDVIYYFENCQGEAYHDEVSDILLDNMENDFNTTLEDDSENQIARQLVEMYHQCRKGDFTIAQKVSQLAPLPKASLCKQAEVAWLLPHIHPTQCYRHSC